MKKDIIDRMYEILGDDKDMACIPPGADEGFISDCNDDLRSMNCPVLPDDYADFLRVMDGFAFNGVELFSSVGYFCSDSDYCLPDVVSCNENFVDFYDGDDELLWIGRDDLDYYCFNNITGKYETRDHECLSDVFDIYDDFEQLFVEIVLKRII